MTAGDLVYIVPAYRCGVIISVIGDMAGAILIVYIMSYNCIVESDGSNLRQFPTDYYKEAQHGRIHTRDTVADSRRRVVGI